MDMFPLWLPVVFFLVAVVYASAGFGGGSAYLAVLALAGFSHHVIPQTALVCNLVVSAGGVWHFHRGGHLDFRRVWPFVVTSIPAAFLGGTIVVGRRIFVVLLAVSLLCAGARLFIQSPGEHTRTLSVGRAWAIGPLVGALLGFLAGVVGIGGGIFLAPVLLLAGWATSKQAAAAASLFILVNSAAGMGGQLAKGWQLNATILPLCLAVLIGGQVGSRTGSVHLASRSVRRVLASLIIVVSLRLLWGVL